MGAHMNVDPITQNAIIQQTSAGQWPEPSAADSNVETSFTLNGVGIIGLNIPISAFCPHSVSVCSVWFL
jgi:hypothetical protein